MKIVGFYVKKNSFKDSKIREINIDVDKAIMKATVTLIFVNGLTTVAYAGSVSESMQPIINVLKDLAEPVAYGFMIKGFMKIMAGDEHDGIKTIKFAAGGYVGIQWIPYIFKLIKGVTFS